MGISGPVFFLPRAIKDAESWAWEEVGEAGRELQRLMGACFADLPSIPWGRPSAGESIKLTETQSRGTF